MSANHARVLQLKKIREPGKGVEEIVKILRATRSRAGYRLHEPQAPQFSRFLVHRSTEPSWGRTVNHFTHGVPFIAVALPKGGGVEQS